jgi:hypothetical protein
MSIPPPSSQRTLGSKLVFARSMFRAENQSNIKVDPSVRWNDDTGAGALAARKTEVPAV